MKKIFFVFAILLSGFSFAQEVRWGATANVHSSSIEGIHDFSRGRIAPSVGLFMEIPLETFQKRSREVSMHRFVITFIL